MEVAVIILRRPSGQYFVHQRKADKKIFPNLFGLGAGGKVDPGERPEQAARRELKEEAGIGAEPLWLFSLPFCNEQFEWKLHVYEVVTEEQLQFDDREWQCATWMEPCELEQLAAEQGIGKPIMFNDISELGRLAENLV